MKYTFVTSTNLKYWDEIAEFNLNSWNQHLPPDVDVLVFSEDKIEHNLCPRFKFFDLYAESPELVEFSQKYQNNSHVNNQTSGTKSYKFKGVKFAHKTFAIFSAVNYIDSGWLIWLDNDVFMHETLTYSYLEDILPIEKSIVYLGRPSMYSECGFVGYNLDNSETKKFLKDFKNVYLSGEIEQLQETHDSFIFDHVRLQKDQKLFQDLNNKSETNKPPFPRTRLKETMVHTKGLNKEMLQKKFLKKIKQRKTNIS